MQYTENQIYETVRTLVANSLAIDTADISNESRLIADLGMDSLDFVDIIFSMEQSFGTKVRDSELNKILRPDKAAVAKMPQHLSEEEIIQLSPLLPALHVAAEDGPVPRQKVFQCITIQTLVILVARKLDETLTR